MSLGAIFGAVSIAATIGSAIMGASAAKKQARAFDRAAGAQRDANKISQSRANLQAHRERLSQQREARIRRAQIVSSGARGGLGGISSSGITGATSSVSSQLGSNIGTIGQMQDFAGQLSAANQRVSDATSSAATHGARGAAWQSALGGIAGAAGSASTAFGGGVQAGLEAGGGNTHKSIFDV